MAKEPVRLIEDRTLRAALRSDVELASEEHQAYAARYDAAAKVAALQAALAGTLVASSAAAQLGWVAKTVLGVVGASALVLSGAGLHAAWQTREQHSTARPATLAAPTPARAPAPPSEHAAPVATEVASQNVSELRVGEPSARQRASASEARQLARIRALLQASAADKALRLAERGQRELGQSVLWQEREALAVLALFELGRSDDATARAHALLDRYPDSPFRAEIDQRLRLPHED